MQRKECKVGTKVLIRAVIVENDASDDRPVRVRPLIGSLLSLNPWFSPDNLELAPHDPARKFRKGDIAKLDYKGRGRDARIPEGTEVEVLQDECSPCRIKVKVESHIDFNGWMYVNVDHLVLIKPIEEIEAEAPYFVKRDNNVTAFSIVRKDRETSIITVWFGDFRGVTSEEAEKKAKELCDELNRKHQKFLNA